MRLPIVAVAMSLLCDVIESRTKTDGARDWSEGCQNCAMCSAANGCVRCVDRLFLLLQRDGISQHGTCLQACPKGYYGIRGRDMNRCIRCRSGNCEHCFNRDFCTQCKPGFRVYSGRCVSICPAGSVPHHDQCIDECVLVSPSPWSKWSICLRDSAPCGFRWGLQTRTRWSTASNQTHGPDRTTCPARSETRRCRMKRRCPTDGRMPRMRGGGRKRQRKPIWMLANSGSANTLDIF
ncbi:R-spondin-4 [Corythoichthys intestinalis]|uniref:R-spondin-4 n=1 Tax=Corythoichthys intestinalis TaxID=161448 RepID=UPI0025A5E0B0|nr:R-spondin-4 [Corythoichthys intestinalis]